MLDPPLTEVRWSMLHQVAQFLNSTHTWPTLIDQLVEIDPDISNQDLNQISSNPRPAENLLLELANRGYSRSQLAKLLDQCRLTEPQFILRRKFASVVCDCPLEIVDNDNGNVVVKCGAGGFPYPQYQWIRDGIDIDGETNSQILLRKCLECCQSGNYLCKISNEVWPCGMWTNFYLENGRQYSSNTTSPTYFFDNENSTLCEFCSRQKVNEKLAQAMKEGNTFSPPISPSTHSTKFDETFDDLYAVDKVALLISNSEYSNLPRLLTPPCDAEVLADGLLTLGFKTVTMADLGLEDMKIIMHHYVQLIAHGIYAVFYFVGHGFEAQGQCYLLPVDAPGSAYNPGDCICVEWLLSLMQEKDPALNCVLLDMCRKCPPSKPENFRVLPQHEYVVNRNLVFGYATSRDIGAYEVKGETNGIFMKYLKDHIRDDKSIVDVLRIVNRDVECDPSAARLQYPEIRTMLSRQRGWTDPIDPSGHSNTFDLRTLQWQRIHELPEPVKVMFDCPRVNVTIWFDFCGPYSNMIYVFTSVLLNDDVTANDRLLAHLVFPNSVESVNSTVCSEIDEGISVRSLLKQLHKIKDNLAVTVQLKTSLDISFPPIAQKDTFLGHILVSKLNDLIM